MASRPFASIGAAKSQLRWRIISTYQRAQRIIAAAASASADTQQRWRLMIRPANIYAQTSSAPASSSPTSMRFLT
jgi:hypothetical protein